MTTLIRTLVATAVISLFAGTLLTQTGARRITVLKMDTSIVQGEMISLNDKAVVVRSSEGTTITVSLDDVHELIFVKSDEPTTATTTRPRSSAPADPEAVARCANAFRRILSAVEIGVTIYKYREELLETKVLLDSAIADVPAGPQRAAFVEALNDLTIAADAWQFGIQNDGIPTKNDFYRSLNERYALGVDPKIGRKVDHAVVLRIIWAKAGERLQSALK